MSSSAISELRQYSACDISDALLAIEKPLTGQRKHAGFLSDLVHINPKPSSRKDLLIYPAYTVQFQPNSSSASARSEPESQPNIPSGNQWSDLADADSIVVVQQPSDQKCAVVGGIHMLRLFKRGVKGLVVDGRVRDVSELANGVDMPVWAKGRSTVGAGAESKPSAVQVPVQVSEVLVHPGDLVCVDEVEGGVVRIPVSLVDDVLSWLQKRGDSEEKILEMVRQGGSVAEAFAKYRQK